MGRQGGHRGPIPGVWGLSCAGGSARRVREWDWDGGRDQEWDGGESAPEAAGRSARKRHTGQAGHAGGSVTPVHREHLPGEGHLCARTPVPVSRPPSPLRPQPRGGRARRAGDSRTLHRAGASRLPVPIPVSAEATRAPWPHRTPPCSGSAGDRAQEPPKPRSRLSSWGMAAAGRRHCCWPSPGGISPR